MEESWGNRDNLDYDYLDYDYLDYDNLDYDNLDYDYLAWCVVIFWNVVDAVISCEGPYDWRMFF